MNRVMGPPTSLGWIIAASADALRERAPDNLAPRKAVLWPEETTRSAPGPIAPGSSSTGRGSPSSWPSTTSASRDQQTYVLKGLDEDYFEAP